MINFVRVDIMKIAHSNMIFLKWMHQSTFIMFEFNYIVRN